MMVSSGAIRGPICVDMLTAEDIKLQGIRLTVLIELYVN